MKYLLLATSIVFCTVAQSHDVNDCNKKQSHPKYIAECFIQKELQKPTHPDLRKVISDFKNQGYGDPTIGEPSSNFVRGTCKDTTPLICDWTYLVSSDVGSYPQSGDLFSKSESIQVLVEASHDTSKSPRILKVLTSTDLIR